MAVEEKLRIGMEVSIEYLLESKYRKCEGLVFENYVYKVLLREEEGKFYVKEIRDIPRDYTSFFRCKEHDQNLQSKSVTHNDD